MNKTPLHSFEDINKLNTHLSHYIAHCLHEAIKDKGKASLIVSGGSTPKKLFEKLCLEKIAWDKVTITLADERWVEPTHNDSNEKMVRETLLQNEAKVAHFIGLKQPNLEAHEAEEACHQALTSLPFPPTVCILGMGEDGHTASLFPKSKELPSILEETNLTCKACTPTEAPHTRMTLTPHLINQASTLILHLVGEKKMAVLNQSLRRRGCTHHAYPSFFKSS